MALHEHNISIEYNSPVDKYPITVSVERSGQTRTFNGTKLKPLLSKATDYIILQEREEGYNDKTGTLD